MSGERDDDNGAATGPEVGSVAEEAVKLFGAMSDWAKDATQGMEAHASTDAGECPQRWCPVCRAADAVRGLSPEVRTQLTAAATSLLNAAASLLATAVPDQHQRAGVEHIDLDDATEWPEDPAPEPEEDR